MDFVGNLACLKHSPEPGYPHPESAARLASLFQWVNRLDRTQFHTGKKAPFEMIRRVHSDSLIDTLQQSSEGRSIRFSPDTGTNKFTFEAALYSAGCSIQAVESSQPSKSYFALCRPPGHHATPDQAMGFCYFNNIAIGVRNLQEKALKKTKSPPRIAIFDFDFHYGNGTAEIFYDEPEVLYVSIHGDPHYVYPGVGFLDEAGSGEGQGFNVAIPIPLGSTDNDYQYIMQEIVIPIMREFQPEHIAVSAGFDGFQHDSLGAMLITKEGFRKIGFILEEDLRKPLGISISHHLEGGYAVESLSKLVEAYTAPWRGKSPLGQFKKPTPKKSVINAVANVKSVQKSFWGI